MAVALGTDARKAVMGETLSFSCEARGWDGEHTARCWWVGDGGTCQGQQVARSGHEDGPGVSNPPPAPTHTYTAAPAASFLFRVCEMRIQHVSQRGTGCTRC